MNFSKMTFIDGQTTIIEVANYFNVSKKSIENILRRYKDIFSDHVRIVKGIELKRIKNSVENKGIISNKAQIITFIDKIGIYQISMFLTESKVAMDLRRHVNNNMPEIYEDCSKYGVMRFKLYEAEIKNYLEFSFGEENVETQVLCGKYKLDFVLFDDIHIEVDENGHSGYDNIYELERSEYIRKTTNYTTIRYNPNKDKPYVLMSNILSKIAS